MTDLRTAVRELHRPVQPDDPNDALGCAGCPRRPDLYPECELVLADWPCATAHLVYTAEEIAAERAVLQERDNEKARELAAWQAANPNPGPPKPLWEFLPKFGAGRGGIRYPGSSDSTVRPVRP
jgi:hypothetical protein